MNQDSNLYVAPKIGNYKLTIIDKEKNEKIFQAESKYQNILIQIMDQFPLKKYSRNLTGSDIYLYES